MLIAEVEEKTASILLVRAKAMKPELRLAMLGPPDDPRRCERWMRRGCTVYLAPSSTPLRVAAAVHTSWQHDVMVIDQTLRRTANQIHIAALPNLTAREQEVLGLLHHGFRNADIAATLHVTENTVEFHVRQLLSKLGARNRLEAVERAITLGLY